MPLEDYLTLADYRRCVAEMYARVRQPDMPIEARWRRFCRERDELFRTHPQSALSPAQRAAFTGLHYFPYDPALRFLVELDGNVTPEVMEVPLREDGLMRMRRIGKVWFEVQGQRVALSLFWIMGYGGGLFLPFRDATNGEQTYGGGRYLLDTIKGAHLGWEGERLVLDFNFAYHPSCAYNPRWHCPLAPPENWLSLPIRAGERL
jgi:hypothetical protein